MEGGDSCGYVAGEGFRGLRLAHHQTLGSLSVVQGFIQFILSFSTDWDLLWVAPPQLPNHQAVLLPYS